MRLNTTAIDDLVHICTNYGGHTDENKLLAQLNGVRLALYINASDGNVTLVDALKLHKEMLNRGMTPNIVPMRLHSTTIMKILSEYRINSGHQNESKLKRAFAAIDLTPYDKKVGVEETILVPTEEYVKIINGTTR